MVAVAEVEEWWSASLPRWLLVVLRSIAFDSSNKWLPVALADAHHHHASGRYDMVDELLASPTKLGPNPIPQFLSSQSPSRTTSREETGVLRLDYTPIDKRNLIKKGVRRERERSIFDYIHASLSPLSAGRLS